MGFFPRVHRPCWLALALLIAGCGYGQPKVNVFIPPYQEPELKPREYVTVQAHGSLLITSIDGYAIGGINRPIRLRPGKHTLALSGQISQGSYLHSFVSGLPLEVVAGGHYDIYPGTSLEQRFIVRSRLNHMGNSQTPATAPGSFSTTRAQ